MTAEALHPGAVNRCLKQLALRAGIEYGDATPALRAFHARWRCCGHGREWDRPRPDNACRRLEITQYGSALHAADRPAQVGNGATVRHVVGQAEVMPNCCTEGQKNFCLRLDDVVAGNPQSPTDVSRINHKLRVGDKISVVDGVVIRHDDNGVNVLRQCTPPGDPHRQKQRVEPSVIEAFAKCSDLSPVSSAPDHPTPALPPRPVCVRPPTYRHAARRGFSRMARTAAEDNQDGLCARLERPANASPRAISARHRR